MPVDLENDEVFSAAIEGLPKVVELITTVPEEQRPLALAAAHQSYLQTAQTLGYLGDRCSGVGIDGHVHARDRKPSKRTDNAEGLHWKVSPAAPTANF